MICLELPYIHSAQNYDLKKRRQDVRELRRLQTNSSTVMFGIWDRHGETTALQMNVLVSLSTGVTETSIKVLDQGSFFFLISVVDQGAWLLDKLLDDQFLYLLNAQASVFGGSLVLTNPPHVSE